MVKAKSRMAGKALVAEEDLLDFSVSLAFLELALLESLPLCASGERLLERDLIRVSLVVAFFFSLPLRASGARLLERDLLLVNTPLRPSTQCTRKTHLGTFCDGSVLGLRLL